jgi:hypothetical protein
VSEACLQCGNQPGRRHHLTGRAADGSYLDPDLWGRLCATCHPLVHEDWNTAGVCDDITPETFLDSLELRLRRTAILLGRIADETPDPLGELLTALATAMACWAVGLANAMSALDVTFPTWRTTPGL